MLTQRRLIAADSHLICHWEGIVYVLLGIGLITLTIGGCGRGPSASVAGEDREVTEAIDVRQINVCDEDGNVRFRVWATKSGAELTFLGLNDERQVLISADENGAGFSFYDQTGVPRLGMGAGSDFSEVILFGKDRKPVLWLQASIRKAESSMGFFDSEGDPRIALGTSPQDTGVTIYDEQETVRAVLGTTSKMQKQRPESSLSVFNEAGELIWETPKP